MYIGFGPALPRGAGIILLRYRHHPVPDDEGGVTVGEIIGAGIAGEDHRFAEPHRLGRAAPEPLGAVQRDEGIGGLDQGDHLGAVDARVTQIDAGIEAEIGEAAPFLRRLATALGFDQQPDLFLAGGKGRAKSLDHRFRILAPGMGEEIEHEEEDGFPLRKAKLGAARARAPGRQPHDRRHQP